MNTKNLWGELPEVEESRLPITILKEQATFLGDATNKMLLAQVKTRNAITSKPLVISHKEKTVPIVIEPQTVNHLVHTLSIVAPALNNYAYGILEVKHGVVPFYPLVVTSLVASSKVVPLTCEDESQYVAALESILSSSQVHNIISALLLQSRVAA